MQTTIIKLSELQNTQEFTVNKGDKLVLSDPCYELENIRSGANYILNAKPGVWQYDYNKETKSLDIYESSSYYLIREYGIINNSIFDEVDYFPVDSGQVGVFLKSSYQQDSLVENIQYEDTRFEDMAEKWYRACCEVTCSKKGMGFVPDGFVTGTRYGDGMYPFGIKYDPDTREVAYIRIITSDICENCGAEECDCVICDDCGYEESECCCEICDFCGEKANDCGCEFCDDCGYEISECTCEDDFDSEE